MRISADASMFVKVFFPLTLFTHHFRRNLTLIIHFFFSRLRFAEINAEIAKNMFSNLHTSDERQQQRSKNTRATCQIPTKLRTNVPVDSKNIWQKVNKDH